MDSSEEHQNLAATGTSMMDRANHTVNNLGMNKMNQLMRESSKLNYHANTNRQNSVFVSQEKKLMLIRNL